MMHQHTIRKVFLGEEHLALWKPTLTGRYWSLQVSVKLNVDMAFSAVKLSAVLRLTHFWAHLPNDAQLAK